MKDMLNEQKYFPMGMNPNFINETEVRKCIEEGTVVSGKVVEYDIIEKTFTINICNNVKGVLFNEFFGEFIIQSLYEKKTPTENLLQGDIELFVISNVECLSNKPSHISELKKLIDELVTKRITVLCSCHDIIPADVKTIFENYNSKIFNMKEELTI